MLSGRLTMWGRGRAEVMHAYLILCNSRGSWSLGATGLPNICTFRQLTLFPYTGPQVRVCPPYYTVKEQY